MEPPGRLDDQQRAKALDEVNADIADHEARIRELAESEADADERISHTHYLADDRRATMKAIAQGAPSSPLTGSHRRRYIS